MYIRVDLGRRSFYLMEVELISVHDENDEPLDLENSTHSIFDTEY
jgi:hypothetical protein